MLYAIDASIYIFQAYFAFTQHNGEGFVSSSDRPVNAVYGFTNWLTNFLINENPNHIVACFDESLETGFRHEIDPLYKSNRELPDEDLAYELLACKKISELLGLLSVGSEKYEADDLIASAIYEACEADHDSCVISRDKDLLQLTGLPTLQEYFKANRTCEVCVWHYPKEQRMFASDVYQKFGIRPELFADYLAIVGDTADAIEGVPGIGPKTVANLFEHYCGWDELSRNVENVHSSKIRGAKRVESLLIEYKDRVDHNLHLTRLIYDVFKQNEYASFSERGFDRERPDIDLLHTLFDEFNFPKHLYKRVEMIVDVFNG